MCVCVCNVIYVVCCAIFGLVVLVLCSVPVGALWIYVFLCNVNVNINNNY